jgi:hypothetical protein
MTAKPPKVPMSPLDLPQQKIYEVLSMPPRPASAKFVAGYLDFPAGIVPKQGVPRSPTYLFGSEWSESPYHGSVDGWYLHARRNHWLLWQRSLNDNDYPWTWDWNLVGYCDRRGIDEHTAAMHLIFEFWKHRCVDGGYYRNLFEWINEEGFLSVAEIAAIGREVLKLHGGDGN